MRAITNLIKSVGLIFLVAACADEDVTAPVLLAPEVSSPLITVAVSPGDMAGWTLRVGGASSAHFEVTPDDRSAGTGALGFALGTAPEDEVSLRNERFVGTKLGDLTTLTYRVYISEGAPGGAAPFIVLPIDLNNDGFIDDQIVFRPEAVPGVWQSWDALGGAWHSTSSLGDPGEDGLRSLASYVAAAPDARIASAIILGAWDTGGPDRLTGELDTFVIGIGGSTTSFDFGAR